MALFSYPVCTWLCQYVNMGVRKWLEKSAEKQKYKMRKTANPLSRKAFRAVSFSATKDKRCWIPAALQTVEKAQQKLGFFIY